MLADKAAPGQQHIIIGSETPIYNYVARSRLVGKRFAYSQKINANLSDRVIDLFIEYGTNCAVCLRCICIYIVESCMFLYWSGYSCRHNSGLRVDVCVALMQSFFVFLLCSSAMYMYVQYV